MTKYKFDLTKTQKHIYDSVLNAVKNHSGRFDCVIQGYAGTGKSTTTARIIRKLSNMGTIAVTSPTHKANNVLFNMLEAEGVSDPDIMTIHSFLGLKLVYKQQKQVLEYDQNSPNCKKMVDVLIIDECSMISTDMFLHIMKQASRVRRAIIFIGDECQLAPVEPEKLGTIVSCTFGHGHQYQLTEVLRQALDNPITVLATDIRSCIESGINPLTYINDIEDDNSTILKTHSVHAYLSSYYDMITGGEDNLSFTELLENVDRYKMISYTNRNVDSLNMQMRNRLIPHGGMELIEGEPIVFDEATLQCPFSNQFVTACPKLIPDIWMGINCYRVDGGKNGSYYVVGPQSKQEYQNHLNKMVTQINLKSTNPHTKKPYNWGDYYIIKEKISVLGYPYCQTMHKSQGSTFDVVWLDLEYVNKMEIADMARTLYTAITRPKEALIIKM